MTESEERQFVKYGPELFGSTEERKSFFIGITNFFEDTEEGEENFSNLKNDFGKETAGMFKSICKSEGEFLKSHKSVAENLNDEIFEWINSVNEKMTFENPFLREENFLNQLKNLSPEEIEKLVLNDFAAEKMSVFENTDFNFFKNQFNKLNEEISNQEKKLNSQNNQKKNEKSQIADLQLLKEKKEAVVRNLLSELDSKLMEKLIQFRMKVIDEMRQQFLSEFYEKLEKYKALEKVLSPFMGETGYLWGMCKGNFYNYGFEILEKYADLLEKDESLQEFAALLGKQNRAQLEYEKELLEKIVTKTEYNYHPAYKGQICGLRVSNDISSVLPGEMALLKNPLTKKLFELKFAQQQLLSFKYENQFPQSYSESQKEEVNVAKEKKDPKGPVIICVDTSGSMSGTPELVAKTITYAISQIAIKEKRKCYLISFSCGIEVMDLGAFYDKKSNPLDNLVSFLRMSFNGGTDCIPALEEAIKMLQTNDYKNADVLMVSDFIMDNLDSNESFVMKIEEEKQKKTDFYSLVIGSSGNEHTIKCFNHNWLYDMRSTNCNRHLIEQLKDAFN